MLTHAQISCVIARAGETDTVHLTIADVVADYRSTATGTAAARAAGVFTALPGCEISLVPDDGHDGYLAFTRGGQCFEIRPAPDGDDVQPAVAEACAAALYARVCLDRYPASLARTSSA